MTEQRTAPESSAGKLSDETVAEIVERILGPPLALRVVPHLRVRIAVVPAAEFAGQVFDRFKHHLR